MDAVSAQPTRRHLAAALAALGAAACARPTTTPVTPTVAPPPSTPEPKEVVILAASSLTDAFTEMGSEFPSRPGEAGVRLVFSFGASSTLRAQLEQGAPADLFASADEVQMEAAIRAGLMRSQPAVFAHNRLVVVLPRDNRGGISSLADLARPGLKLVTTPKEVPVGAYTRRVLEKMAADAQFGAGFDQRTLANAVSEEANVRQALVKVQLGEADAAFVYASDVGARVARDVRVLDIPDRFNVLAAYQAGVPRRAKAPATAQRVVDYLRAPAGQALLKRHGFVAA